MPDESGALRHPSNTRGNQKAASQRRRLCPWDLYNPTRATHIVFGPGEGQLWMSLKSGSIWILSCKKANRIELVSRRSDVVVGGVALARQGGTYGETFAMEAR